MLYLVEAHPTPEKGNVVDAGAGPGPVIEKIVERFNAEYFRTYGYLEEEENIQLVNLRVVACLGTIKPKLKRMSLQGDVPEKAARKGTREVFFTENKKYSRTAVYDGQKLKPGNRLKGAAIIELPTTTIVLRPGQALRVDAYGNFVAARKGVNL